MKLIEKFFPKLSLFLILFFIVSNTHATSCSADRDCAHLNETIKLDQNSCVGQAYTFENIQSSLLGSTTGGAAIPYLMGKQYTQQIQTGYTKTYSCQNRQCQLTSRVPIIQNCTYGCLITPTQYEGKTWHDLCICKPGWVKDARGNPIVYCGPNGSRYAYYTHLDWTCEKIERIAGICGIGERCVVKSGETTCETIGGEQPINYPDGTQYTFKIPHNPTQPITIAVIQNGKTIAQKAISNLSAEQYLLKNGPITSSQAYAFAQSTGLTSIVASALQQKTTTTASSKPSTTYSASYNGSTNYSSTPIRMQVVASATNSLSAYRAPTATYKTYSTTSTASTATYAYSTSQTKSTYTNNYSSSTTYSPTKTTYSTAISPYSTSNYRIQTTTAYNPTRTAYSTKNPYTSAYRATTQTTATVSTYK
ncbi:MAG: hypothetical protein QXK06_04550 [Candidatus Diapherotrites archaeon]